MKSYTGFVCCYYCKAWGRLPEMEPLHTDDCEGQKYRYRDCGACGQRVDKEKPDPCLGWLPGVNFACCGHGEGNGYIAFSNFTTVRFKGGLVIEHPEMDDLVIDLDGAVVL